MSRRLSLIDRTSRLLALQHYLSPGVYRPVVKLIRLMNIRLFNKIGAFLSLKMNAEITANTDDNHNSDSDPNPRSNECVNDSSDQWSAADDGLSYETSGVSLRDQFGLPKYILNGVYESRDQFITLDTMDGIKLLHIYHRMRGVSDGKATGAAVGGKPAIKVVTIGDKSVFNRLFCDYTSGWTYRYERDGPYVKYRLISG